MVYIIKSAVMIYCINLNNKYCLIVQRLNDQPFDDCIFIHRDEAGDKRGDLSQRRAQPLNN